MLILARAYLRLRRARLGFTSQVDLPSAEVDTRRRSTASPANRLDLFPHPEPPW